MRKILRKKRKSRFRIRGRSTISVVIAITLIVFFAALMVVEGRLSPDRNKAVVALGYTCCDTGDGEACKPVPGTSIFYKGIKAEAVEEYWLLKSNVYLRSQDHHIDPDPNGATTPTGERIFYNPRSERNKKDWAPECFSNIENPGKQKYGYDDFIYGPPPPGESAPPEGASGWCYAIPNEQLIYVCRAENAPGECDSKSGNARFDVYYRIKDLELYGIHNIIKNCVKPDLAPTGEFVDQNIVLPSYPDPGKDNLQLETFYIADATPSADWISPYCKPAIYLYPEKPTAVHVKIKPLGKLTYTIPQYPESGWSVVAKPNGDILSGKDVFDYLYYEAEVPDDEISLPQSGFVYGYEDMHNALPVLLKKLGLNDKETSAFVEYWLGVLPVSPFYAVRIIPESNLDRISPLSIVPQPQSNLRVTLHFEALEEPVQLPKPDIRQFERKGFTMVEWGGIFKGQEGKPFSCFN